MNFIIDRHFKKNTEEYRKALHFSYTSFSLVIMLIIFSFICQYSQVYSQVSFTPLILLNALILFILYFKGDLKLATDVICGGLLITLLKPILQTGGVTSNFFMWILMIPLCAFTLGNLKKGAYWFLIIIIYQIFIYLYDSQIFSKLNQPIDIDKLTIMLNYICFHTVLISSIFAYEKIKKRQSDIIQKQLDDIMSKSEILTQKNIELERFAFIASHDLRTPLRNIISFVGLLNRKLKNIEDEDIRQYMSFIKDYAYHMTQIVDNILHFAKIDKTSNQSIELVDLESVKNSVLTSLNEKIELRNFKVITEGVLPKVKADKTHMVQLLQNLLENAITYNENPQPTLTIGITENTQTGKYIYVKDNGIGIDVQYQEKVFEMFSRLHSIEKYPGTGLGLAICKKIVMKYGGRVWLESVLNIGTTVKFILPAPSN